MEIKRENFRFNRIVNVDDILDKTNLLMMTQEDIDADTIVHNFILEDNDNMVVLQNDTEPHQEERYCYIKFHTLIGDDGNTKLITIDNIIVDENLIDYNLFRLIFIILLQQEDSTYPNRIQVTQSYNERFHGRINEVANNIANRIVGLYNKWQ